MGFNSTVIVLNDALDQIEKDPYFGKNLAKAILRVGCYGNKVDIQSGNHCKAATVIETHHADYYEYIKVGGNYGEVVKDPIMVLDDIKHYIRECENHLKDISINGFILGLKQILKEN